MSMARTQSMPAFAEAFRRLFPDLGPSNPFLDSLLSAAFRRPCLDVVKLDDALIAKHGQYKGSMKEFVAAGRYGAAAVTFIEEHI